ncbi:MAG: lactate permease LctP family transporter [Acidobacteria bacterium]|nr:lactate permease LctP family transporter [Acidobacteriota bacterium]MDA1235654.1 lactate permease LctP family transporter [Acidobacteriota bacterium]
MWPQNYTPLGDSLGLSAVMAALPIFVLLLLLGFYRKPAWVAALAGLAAATGVALFGYGMPVGAAVGAITNGAAFGLLPIGWILFSAILLYRLSIETGKFEIIKDSIGSLTPDRRLQALLIAFAFGAFIEGAAGFGSPVAVAAAMLVGLGFSPFYAAGICLLANTAPVAFGSIGIPVTTLAVITGLPVDDLSAMVGRLCAPIALIIPAYLVMVMGGWRALEGVFVAALVCGGSFASVQFLVSNYIGAELVDICASLAAIGSLIILLKVWKPRDSFHLEGDASDRKLPPKHPTSEVITAWTPYFLLVIFVLLWGQDSVKVWLNSYSVAIEWPGLHNVVQRVAPVVSEPSPYPAIYSFAWLSAAGTACFLASVAGALVLRVTPAQFMRALGTTTQQLALPLLTISSVLGLAFLLNYCGATGTLGLAFAATGVLFPFFSALLGWVGVFLTGSDTSANALFGNLQVVTAAKLNLNPVLMASANSAGGVMGKMISLQSIAVAAAATGMSSADEAKLFRFTLKHSVLLASVIGLLTMFYAYVLKL